MSEQGDETPESAILSVDLPDEGTVLSEPSITISGTVVGGSGSERLFIDGSNIQTGPGAFSHEIELFEGKNVVRVNLVSESGETIQSASSSFFKSNPEIQAELIGEGGGNFFVSDPNSEIFGTEVLVPQGALQSEEIVFAGIDREHFPNVPFDYEVVGPPVIVQPIGQSFLTPITIKIPYNVDLMPEGVDQDDIIVLALGDDDWEELGVVSVDSSSVSFQVTDIFYDPFVAVVEKPVRSGELLILTEPEGASIYVDSVDTGVLSPALLQGVDFGERNLKLYLDGFNEVFLDVQLFPDTGAVVHEGLAITQGPVPSISLDQDLSSISSTTEAQLVLSGSVSFEGQALTSQLVVFSLNGRDTIDVTDTQGFFDGAVVLRRGLNQLQLRTTGPNGQTFATEVYEITLGSPDITATLTWDTDETDIDLHVFDPDGRHAWYGDLGGIPGGMLDRDDTDGRGPEIFTLSDPKPGTYSVNVNSWSIDEIVTRARLKVDLGNETIFEGSYTFTSDDQNAGNGRSGAASAFWKAFEFEVGEIEIAQIQAGEGSSPNDAIFTTEFSENQISVTLEAPDGIPDSELAIEVTELNNNFTVPTDGITGRQMSIPLTRMPLGAADFRQVSSPLRYGLVAFRSTSPDDTRSIQADVVQELNSQIRQEYVDAREGGRSGFTLSTPDRSTIITASEFPGSPYFLFGKFVQDSDYRGRGVVEESVDMANAIREAVGHPIRLTSGYRNPRSNARTPGSVPNSAHQTGSAIDLNPLRNVSSYPDSILCDPSDPQSVVPMKPYNEARKAINCVAQRLYNDGVTYQAFLHGTGVNEHVHVERNP